MDDLELNFSSNRPFGKINGRFEKIAHKAGVTSVIQPGGSIRDTDSVDYCKANGMTMVMTGFRHFKH